MRGIIRRFAKKIGLFLHKFLTHFGIFVVPVTHYAPNPNLHELGKTRELWARKSQLPGLAIDIDRQMAVLRKFCVPYLPEVADHAVHRQATAMRLGDGYGESNFMATYCVLRTLKPARVIEVGSGVSTYGMLAALKKNWVETGKKCAFTAIEPYPTPGLLNLTEVSLVDAPVQSVPFDVFLSLDANDFLFIDSSHTVRPGGDVNFLILEILPRLRQGVVVQFDDIHLPYDHGPATLTNYYHWSETSLLRAFLIFNPKAEIMFSLGMLLCERLASIVELFPDFTPREITEQGLYPDRYKPFDPMPGDLPAAMFIRVL
jgi:hypothetical protein